MTIVSPVADDSFSTQPWKPRLTLTPDTTDARISLSESLDVSALYICAPPVENPQQIIFGSVDGDGTVSSGIVSRTDSGFQDIVHEWGYPFTRSATPVIELDIKSEHWRYSVVLLFVRQGKSGHWCQPDEVDKPRRDLKGRDPILAAIISAVTSASTDGSLRDDDMWQIMHSLYESFVRPGFPLTLAEVVANGTPL